MTSPLIDTAALHGQLHDPALRVLDATLFLPHEGRDATAEFLEAHIPGARFFDIEAFSDPESPLPHMLPPAERFAALAGALGLSRDDSIVVYDTRGIFSAPRVWWMLRLFGHPNVRVLDGGLNAWRGAGYPVESGPGAAWPATSFWPEVHAGRVRGLDDMQETLNSGRELVLDARPAARFAGTMPEPRAGIRAGHMPGAASLPFTALLNGDGTMLSPAALRERLAASGADGSRPVVASCGSGVTAAVITLAMAIAGLPEGAIYDGSWTEWGGRTDTPIARIDA